MALLVFYGLRADLAALVHEFDPARKGFDGEALVLAARSLKMKSQLGEIDFERMANLPTPCLVKQRSGTWALLARYGMQQGSTRAVALLQKADMSHESLTLAELRERLTGEVVQVVPRAGAASSQTPRFNLRWFVPMLLKHRLAVFEMLLASLLVNLLGLAGPIGFQVVMDKVLVNRAYETLWTVGVLLFLAMFAETVLSLLREYLTSHLGCKLDVRLGARAFAKLMGQPLSYFQARQVGEIVQRLRELESVRGFLVNGLLTASLDVPFMALYLWVMWGYASKLTLITLGFIAVFVLIAVVIGPVLRERVKNLYERAAASQAYAVETVKGIRTIKASAQEPWQRKGWEDLLAGQAAASFEAAKTGALGSQLIQGVNRLMMVMLLCFGALEVIAGNLTVGALIAFNMMSQRVTQPVLRLAQLWQNLQEMRVALNRISELMDSPTEDSGMGMLPTKKLQGKVEFREVTFHYPGRDRPALRDLSFSIPAGAVVGVVGRSGSGKSTLGHLLQRFHQPSGGTVLLDDMDLRNLRLSWLRPSLGVVLQDNELFGGTIRDNIAQSDPRMPHERVEAAAELACAADFIRNDLELAYDTHVGEGGALLSGGQHQRIAIARALAADPRLLIFDEATSALDSESTAEFAANLPLICKGRTVFLVTHDLSLLSHCSHVLLLENGALAEAGSPDALRAAGGKLARLFATGCL